MFIVKTIENFLTEEECNKIIDNNLDDTLYEAGIGTKKHVEKKIRDSKINFIKNEIIEEKLLNEIKKYVNLKGYTVSVVKEFQFTKYEKGGHYDWHTDSNNDFEEFSNRFYSTVIQLNDDYSGGDLLYKDENEQTIEFKRGVGNLFIFSSSILHKVNPVIEGDRYSLVNWLSIKEIKDYQKTLL